MNESQDLSFDHFLSAVDDGEGYYLACPDGHGSIPPQRICPDCQRQELTRQPLPSEGEIETYTVVSVGTPQFSDDVPYVTAIARFGPVRLTGLLRGVDPERVAVGQQVTADVGTTETTGEQVIVLEPT